MSLSTTIARRLVSGLTLVAAITAGSAQAALAGHQDLGARDALNQIHHASSAQSAAPDAFERAVNRHLATMPDAFERAVNRHHATMPSALERADAHYSTLSARLGDRLDNTLDPAIANAIASRGPSPSQFDERAPDTIDAALQTHTPLAQVVTGSGFGWGDFGIGAGSMLGLVLLLVGGLRIAAHANRSKRAQPSPA
jgi:hypothetical protein